MTHHINLIAGNKHRQLARQLGAVVEIISTGLMAPINFRAITFVPGTEFTFGSLSFIAGADGRLHASNPEATSVGQVDFDRAERISARSVLEPNSDRLRSRFTPPRYPFGFRNSANTFQHMLGQVTEDETEHKEDMGKNGRTVGVSRPIYDECRAINVILEPLELPDRDNESLHRVLNSPTDSESSCGSWSPVRRLYAITGALPDAGHEAPQGGAGQLPAAEDGPPRENEEDRRALVTKGRQVHEEILQTKMGDQNVFTTPQQNIIAAKVLFDSLEPMMAEDHAATPVLTRIKAMVTAAAIQHHEEGNQAPSIGRPASSRQPSGRERARGSQRNVADARSSINNNRDARNVIDGRRREREEEENRRRDDERERFGIHNDRPPRNNRHDRRSPPRPSPSRQGEGDRVGIDGIRAFTSQLRRAKWPTGFSPKGIKTYDGDRNPEAWLRIYTTAIKAAGGNQNTMANYFPVVLSPTVQDWLTGLPANSINSWGDLCAKFINNFQGSFTKPGVEWDLYQIAQKKNESLRDYIRWFMKKKNTIPGASDPVVMASFRTGIRDPDYSRSWRDEPKLRNQ